MARRRKHEIPALQALRAEEKELLDDLRACSLDDRGSLQIRLRKVKQKINRLRSAEFDD